MNYYSIFTGYDQDLLRSLLEPVPGIGKSQVQEIAEKFTCANCFKR
ncbi:MAG: hypothetical protein V7L29_22265 [Nostoc sp.]